MGDLTKDFNSNDFKCSCCNESKMNKRTVERLQTLKDVLGCDLKIVSGYNCEKNSKSNKSVSFEGRAIELKVGSETIFATINAAMSIGFTGIGIKNKNGQSYLSIDDADKIDKKRVRPYFWIY